MDPFSANEAYRLFTTGVALITTNGRLGPNVMAAEWTFNVSYEPFLISVHIEPGEATHDAIQETKEFGVNLVSEEQLTAMAFAGHFTRHETDKLSSEMFETYPPTKIHAPMIKGCLLNAECRLIAQYPIGDHTAFIGEVIAFSHDREKRPVVLHRGSHRLGDRIQRGVQVGVAVTPSRASAASEIIVEGELAAPDRSGRRVEIQLVDPYETAITTTAAETNRGGYFHATIRVPADVRPGSYRVAARYTSAVGVARLEIE